MPHPEQSKLGAQQGSYEQQLSYAETVLSGIISKLVPANNFLIVVFQLLITYSL
jgi:hypothetical protein